MDKTNLFINKLLAISLCLLLTVGFVVASLFIIPPQYVHAADYQYLTFDITAGASSAGTLSEILYGSTVTVSELNTPVEYVSGDSNSMNSYGTRVYGLGLTSSVSTPVKFSLYEHASGQVWGVFASYDPFSIKGYPIICNVDGGNARVESQNASVNTTGVLGDDGLYVCTCKVTNLSSYATASTSYTIYPTYEEATSAVGSSFSSASSYPEFSIPGGYLMQAAVTGDISFDLSLYTSALSYRGMSVFSNSDVQYFLDTAGFDGVIPEEMTSINLHPVGPYASDGSTHFGAASVDTIDAARGYFYIYFPTYAPDTTSVQYNLALSDISGLDLSSCVLYPLSYFLGESTVESTGSAITAVVSTSGSVTYYDGEGDVVESPVVGGDTDTDDDNWDFNKLGDLIDRIVSLLANVFTIPFRIVVTLFDNFTSFFNALSSLWSFLPPELTSLIVSCFSIALILSIISWLK